MKTKPSEAELTRNAVFNSASVAKNPRKGDPTSLNVAVLPKLKQEIKKRLSRKEVSSLSDFDLETYIIELALIDTSYYKGNAHTATSLAELIEAILAQIRRNKRYWIEGSEVYCAIGEKGEYSPMADELEAQCNEEYENTTLTYSSLRSAIKTHCSNAIWSANRFMQLPRLPVVLFPAVYRYVRHLFTYKSKVADFYLHNLVLCCFLRAKHHSKIELTQREVLHDAKNVRFRRTLKLKAKNRRFEVKGEHSEEGRSVLEAFSVYCEEQVKTKQEHLNLGKAIDSVHEFRLQEEELLVQALAFLKQGFHNFLSATGPIYERVFKMTSSDLDDSSAFFYYDLRTPPQFEAEKEVDPDKVMSLRIYIHNLGPAPGLFVDKMHFDCTDWADRLGRALERYYNSESEVKKRSYRYFSSERTPWSKFDFDKFYEGLELYNAEQLANKKIARHMGPHIDPNHVRYERQQFNQMKKQKTSESYSETTSLVSP